MKNKSSLLGIVKKAKTPTAGEIMAAVNRGDEKVDGAEVLEKPYESQAQSRYIHAKAGEGEKWAKKFVADSAGQKVGDLPEKVEKALADTKHSHESIKEIRREMGPEAAKRYGKMSLGISKRAKEIIGAEDEKKALFEHGKRVAMKEAFPKGTGAPGWKKPSQPMQKAFNLKGHQHFSAPPNPIPAKESLHIAGQDKWNAFVNAAAGDEGERGASMHGAPGQGVENARIFIHNAKQAKKHLMDAHEIIGDNIREVAPQLHHAYTGLATAYEKGEDFQPWQEKINNIASQMKNPDRAEEAMEHIHQHNVHKAKTKGYLKLLGIPEEHHGEIHAAAENWSPQMGKSLIKSVLGKLKKSVPSAKEDKQEAGDKSPSLERVSVAPKEGDTRPFIGSKEAFAMVKKQHERFKKKVEQDRCDKDAKATAIYSMNEADVAEPIMKSIKKKLKKSKESYKTLRSVTLPNGTTVNVYGNNGYERISNGVYRGRYLHSVLAELKLGRKLKGNEEIDHKNGDRKDNKLSNMRLSTTSKHASHTNTERAKQGGFTGEKRYAHSRDATDGKPENMEKAEGETPRRGLKVIIDMAKTPTASTATDKHPNAAPGVTDPNPTPKVPKKPNEMSMQELREASAADPHNTELTHEYVRRRELL